MNRASAIKMGSVSPFVRLVLACMAVADAFVTRSRPTCYQTRIRSAFLTMDMEGAENHHMFRPQAETSLRVSFQKLGRNSTTLYQEQLQRLEQAERSLRMPWKESIEKSNDDILTYMPFWTWQMQFLKDNLTNLRVVSCTDHSGDQDFSFRQNPDKKARIVNICLVSDEYRKIRMTYYDAGQKTQVFNSLWYPNPAHNLPVLGIDLLQFNGKKHLAVVDFQPIHTEEHDHAMPYEHILASIRERYPSLQGKMSARFYDETQFFSHQMLFSRFEDVAIVQEDLFPAFQSYVKAHVNLVKNTPPNLFSMDKVLERQAAYDEYSAQRDPATAMFEAMFGKEWSDAYVHEFLFSMSRSHARAIDDSK